MHVYGILLEVLKKDALPYLVIQLTVQISYQEVLHCVFLIFILSNEVEAQWPYFRLQKMSVSNVQLFEVNDHHLLVSLLPIK